MKKPSSPIKPVKPTIPNSNQTCHRHPIKIDDLFYKTSYYDEDGNEISKKAFHSNYEVAQYVASLQQLADLVPKNISLNNIFIEPELNIHDYGDVSFGDIQCYYTTPYVYEDEVKIYNDALKQYDIDIKTYTDKVIQYKKDNELYKDFLKNSKIQAKKEKLLKELDKLK